MKIDEVFPDYDVIEHHETWVDADPETTFKAVRELDLGRSLPVRILFTARAVPRLLTGKREVMGRLGFDAVLNYGFVMLADDPPHELVVGAVGRFWKPTGGMEEVSAADFSSFDAPGFAKAAMTVYIEDRPHGCLLMTETRVLCTDESARRSFMRYWRLIRPFSVYIRHVMLGEIKRSAEQHRPRATSPCAPHGSLGTPRL